MLQSVFLYEIGKIEEKKQKVLQISKIEKSN